MVIDRFFVPGSVEATHFYDEMFHRNTAPKLLIDADNGYIADANPAALTFYGYSLEEIRRKTIQQINTLSGPQIKAEMERARREERRYFEFRHRLADGELRDVKVYSGPMDIDGRQYLHSIIHDVTQERRYQASLEDYSAILEALPVGVYRFRPDQSPYLESVNPALVQILGAESREALLHYPLDALYQHPEDRARFTEDLIRQGEVHGRELALRTLDGRPVWCSVTARVHRDDSGQPVFDGIVEDITERRVALQSAEAIRQETELLTRLQKLTHNLPGMVCQFQHWPGERGAVLYSSEGIGKLFGLTPQAVNADWTPLFEAIHEQDRASVRGSIEMAARNQAHWHNRFRTCLPDGQILWLEVEASPETLEDGSLLWSGHIRDITERKLTDDMLAALTGELSHLTGKAFFEAACRRLAQSLGMEFAFVGQLNAAHTEVEALGGWSPEGPLEPFAYALADTPCANVVKDDRALHECQVQQLFPRDLLLQTMEIESYVGSSLFDKGRRPMGILVALGRHPLRQQALAERLLALLVEQISAEVLRMQGEAQLRQSASVFEHAREGIMITGADSTIVDVNEAFTQITGYSSAEAVGRTPAILQSGHHGRDHYRAMWKQLLDAGYWSGEVWDRRKNGGLFATMQTISAIKDEQGRVQRYVSIFSDITALKDYQNKLEHIAHYDPLTELPNRSLLSDRLQQSMARAQRSQSQVAVVFIDLDGFKNVNDRHGHDKGDKLLAAVAGSMKAVLREDDTLARIGGDEFIAVLGDFPDPEAAEPVINRIMAAAAEPFYILGLELQVSASAGVSFYPQSEPVAADQLMRQADLAMYEAKQAGKNRYRVFDAVRDRAVRGHNQDLGRIRQALEDDELVLYYQPKVDMHSGQVIGAEALIRWQHPERGLLPPAAFLPHINQEPLALEVGDWVLETAAAQVEAWRAQGLELPVSVNIDGYHLAQLDFVDKLRACLRRHPSLRPGDLELEVLETSALEEVARIGDIIRACEALGVNFALDDFGTGYSTLTYLKRLPAQLLKIDRSFVRDMLDDPDDLAILDGVLGLAEAFRRDAIAEGVETVAHGAMLLSLGCRLAQGYGIARPMPAAAIPDWARDWRPDSAWRERSRIAAEDLPALFSMVEHRAWVLQLRAYLKGEAPQPPVMAASRCRFGEWLRSTGRQRYANHPLIKRIDALHEKVHDLGGQLAAIKDDGRSEEALSGFTDIEVMRDSLLKYMEALVSSTLSEAADIDSSSTS